MVTPMLMGETIGFRSVCSSMTSKQYPADYKQRHVLISRNCLALVLHRTKSDVVISEAPQNGHDIFLDFLQQNSMCFWNSCLSRSVSSLEYKGYLVPCTVLISGTDFSLEVVRSAWARRVLRPPKGYTINKLGDLSVLEMVPAPQTHFAPLSEALCKVVADLNGESKKATTNAIGVKLEENFPEMQTPSEEILHKALNSLIREGKLHCTANSYNVTGPDTSKHLQASSPSFERQMLMTNEEAIVKLHGNHDTTAFLHASTTENSSFLTQGSSDLQVIRMRQDRPKSSESLRHRLSYLANELNDAHTGERKQQQSMLTKILRRMKSSKQHITFSAQFPPPDTLLCHSVATQTQKIYSPRQEQKIPWDFLRSGGDSTHPVKGSALQNPSYRHSLNSSFKRRHKQRTSSSESSKITKSPAKFPNDKCDSNISSGSATLKPGSNSSQKSNPEKRYKIPRKCSKVPLTKQVKRIKEVSSSNPPRNIPTFAEEDVYSEEAGKDHSSLDSPKNIQDIDSPFRTLNFPKRNIRSIDYPFKTLNSPKKGTKDIDSPFRTLDSSKKNIKDVDSSLRTVDSLKEDIKDIDSSFRTLYSPKKDIKDSDSSFRTLYSPKKDINHIDSQFKTLNSPMKDIHDALIDKQDIVIDNTLSVELSPPKGNVSTTVVTEETTVTKGKVVTVTSITTSLSRNTSKEKPSKIQKEAKKNDLNQDNAKCSEVDNSLQH